MAKWGQGDPRWIVEERPDAVNVNNWHWVEKNATPWSQDKIKELFSGLVIENEQGFIEIKELSKVEGEATANNRKGKMIFFYEWIIKGQWSGKLKNGSKKIKGKFEIPNLSEEHEANEIELDVTCDSTTDEAYQVKEIMRTRGLEVIREQAAKYINSLKEEFGQGIILPSKNDKESATNGKGPVKNPEIKPKENTAKQQINKVVDGCSNMKDLGVRIHTKKLTTKEEFKCQASDLYRALTDKQMVEAFTGCSAVIEPVKGERFSLMDGYVTGEFVELIPDKKIVQKWRLKSWPAEHYSQVSMELEEKDDCTVLHLTQTGVPDTEFDNTQEGWKINYWQRMNQVFGFSSRLF